MLVGLTAEKLDEILERACGSRSTRLPLPQFVVISRRSHGLLQRIYVPRCGPPPDCATLEEARAEIESTLMRQKASQTQTHF